MIALLCPTRDRKEKFKRMCESAASTSTSEVSIYSGSNGVDNYAQFSFPLDCPTVFMWNELAKEAMRNEANKLFMLAADDMVFSTPLWDKAIIDHYDALEDKVHVYALCDSRDNDGTPHVIVSREYIEAMGYFLPPIFLHWFVDTWTVAIARAYGCFTHLKDYLLIHDKPSDEGKADDTHNRIRKMGWHGRDVAVNVSCQHYLGLEKMRLTNMVRT